jgi:hypothetical protein
MSAPRKVYAMHAARLQTHEKTALLIPQTATDRYHSGDDQWQSVDGTPTEANVQAVEHMGGRYQTTVGQRLAVYDDESWAAAGTVRVRRIQAVSNGDLTETQVGTLGFASLADYHQHTVAARGASWLIDVELEANDA